MKGLDWFDLGEMEGGVQCHTAWKAESHRHCVVFEIGEGPWCQIAALYSEREILGG